MPVDHLKPQDKMRELYAASNDLYCGAAPAMATQIKYRVRCKNCGAVMLRDEPAHPMGVLCSDECWMENMEHYA